MQRTAGAGSQRKVSVNPPPPLNSGVIWLKIHTVLYYMAESLKKINYKVSIVRENSKGKQTPIDIKEWENHIDSNQAMIYVPSGFAQWNGHPKKRRCFFYFEKGLIHAVLPDKITLEKLYEIAVRLDCDVKNAGEFISFSESENWKELLKSELYESSGAFLLKLRCDLKWSRSAFSRLIRAMYMTAFELRDEDKIDRWLTEAFRYCEFFIKDWSSHPNFPKEYSQKYYERCYKTLHDLCSLLFKGSSPYMDDTLEKKIFETE